MDFNKDNFIKDLRSALSRISPPEDGWQRILNEKNMTKKKTPYIVLAVAASIILLLGAGSFMALRALPWMQTKSSGMDSWKSADMIAMVNINGKVYHAIQGGDAAPGREIAVVETSVNEATDMDYYESIRDKVYSTCVPVGMKIYEWEGYDPEFRV